MASMFGLSLQGLGVGTAAGGATTDTDAAAWATAVTGAGGTYSASTLAAVSAFCVSAKASNYWTKLNRINLFCGDQLAAALVPLKVGGGSATETNVNFVGGDYTEATGLTGNGTSKYLRTGLIPSVSLTINDTHLAVYNRASVVGQGLTIGSSSAAGAVNRMFAPFTDTVFYSDQYDGSSGRASFVSATPYGFVVGSRTATTSHKIYRNGASIGTSATAGGALSTVEIYVCGANASGVAGNFSSNPVAAYSIGPSLNDADATAYNTHMQAFQTALSRQV